MFQNWGIQEEQVHLVIRDNGTNIVKALKDARLPHFECFAHTLRIVVHVAVIHVSQRAVTDTCILSTCRKIVGHFRHSCLAYSKLRATATPSDSNPLELFPIYMYATEDFVTENSSSSTCICN